MPTHHDEPLLERYQREHRKFEGMSMSEHTPEPWKAYCRDLSHKDGEPWPEDKFLQWEVSGPRVPDGRGEFYEADARLIAAAPDLLEALRRSTDVLDRLTDKIQATEFSCSKEFYIALDEIDLARAAIAKAQGEQP